MVGGDSKFVHTRTHVHKFPHTHTTHISKRKRDREHTQHSPNGGRDQGKINEIKKYRLDRIFPPVSTIMKLKHGRLKGPIPYGITWRLMLLKVLHKPPRPISIFMPKSKGKNGQYLQ